MSLDDKLDKILKSNAAVNLYQDRAALEDYEKLIPAIKQVLMDDPYIKLALAYKEAGGPEDAIIISRKDIERNNQGYMTGQEWQRKFTDELGKPTYMSDEDGRHAVFKMEWIAEALQKASGIDKN